MLTVKSYGYFAACLRISSMIGRRSRLNPSLWISHSRPQSCSFYVNKIMIYLDDIQHVKVLNKGLQDSLAKITPESEDQGQPSHDTKLLLT